MLWSPLRRSRAMRCISTLPPSSRRWLARLRRTSWRAQPPLQWWFQWRRRASTSSSRTSSPSRRTRRTRRCGGARPCSCRSSAARPRRISRRRCRSSSRRSSTDSWTRTRAPCAPTVQHCRAASRPSPRSARATTSPTSAATSATARHSWLQLARCSCLASVCRTAPALRRSCRCSWQASGRRRARCARTQRSAWETLSRWPARPPCRSSSVSSLADSSAAWETASRAT
mmetsp:Transcript_12790/g.51050  ORF Transcript_12790/g.51050 Transcript_12790/m.51050 type:complete len:229 (-) Transcript_12790:1054-1740(-)